MPNRTDAAQSYETLFQAIREALPEEHRGLIHDLDHEVGRRLADTERRVAAMAGRVVRAVAES